MRGSCCTDAVGWHHHNMREQWVAYGAFTLVVAGSGREWRWYVQREGTSDSYEGQADTEAQAKRRALTVKRAMARVDEAARKCEGGRTRR